MTGCSPDSSLASWPLVAVARRRVGMLLSRNAVYAALFLVLNFATVAVFYLILGAPFIALAQMTVYAGAIMVLFLFVIMLLGAEKLQRGQSAALAAPAGDRPGPGAAGRGGLPGGHPLGA